MTKNFLYGLTVDYKTAPIFKFDRRCSRYRISYIFFLSMRTPTIQRFSRSILLLLWSVKIDINNGTISILEMASIVNDSNFFPTFLVMVRWISKGFLRYRKVLLICFFDTSLLGADYIQVDRGVALIIFRPSWLL
ncbi:MAG: hypothetical protein CM1200mP3_05190 [Chloroflexota bacterium]|nr:MAG: hypothetical protein CM1200mP3_05190 [Chloroflexota bacterium]